MRCRWAAFLGVIGLSFSFPALAQSPADDIANRFANPPVSEAASSYEADMLQRARAEALERAEAEERARAEADARQRGLEELREAEARALADKLRRAQDARQAKDAASRADIVSDQPFRPALTSQDQMAKPEPGAARAPIVIRPPSMPAALPQPEADPGTTSERAAAPDIDAARPSRSPALTPDEFDSRPADFAGEPQFSSPPMALGRSESASSDSAYAIDPKVTILLVMEPGKKGIRRFNKTADPVVCVGVTCFVSNGAGAPASVLEMRRALGPGNTFGRRAGACRGRLSCIFRGVTLAGQQPAIQPVDLKVLVHDRREAKPASPDASCRVVAGRISCAGMIVAPGYRAWIVPERIAQEAGPQALETAVLRGLATAGPMREASVSR
jgi:colicin import membrane protein